MKTKQKNVYYCDHCKKHGLLRNMMERHEERCTMNPQRVCHWGDEPHTLPHGLAVLIVELQQQCDLERRDYSNANGLRWFELRPRLAKENIDWLHDEVDGCPACMLAILRQAGLDWSSVWKYSDEVDRYREAERQRWRDETEEADRRLIEG